MVSAQWARRLSSSSSQRLAICCCLLAALVALSHAARPQTGSKQETERPGARLGRTRARALAAGHVAPRAHRHQSAINYGHLGRRTGALGSGARALDASKLTPVAPKRRSSARARSARRQAARSMRRAAAELQTARSAAASRARTITSGGQLRPGRQRRSAMVAPTPSGCACPTGAPGHHQEAAPADLVALLGGKQHQAAAGQATGSHKVKQDGLSVGLGPLEFAIKAKHEEIDASRFVGAPAAGGGTLVGLPTDDEKRAAPAEHEPATGRRAHSDSASSRSARNEGPDLVVGPTESVAAKAAAPAELAEALEAKKELVEGAIGKAKEEPIAEHHHSKGAEPAGAEPEPEPAAHRKPASQGQGSQYAPEEPSGVPAKGGSSGGQAAAAYPLYESPRLRALPQRCHARVRDLMGATNQLLALVERVGQRVLLDLSLTYTTRESLSRRLAKIRRSAQESRMAANLANLGRLNESARAAGVELMRLANDQAAHQLEPRLRPFALYMRKIYGAYRKACKSS